MKHLDFKKANKNQIEYHFKNKAVEDNQNLIFSYMLKGNLLYGRKRGSVDVKIMDKETPVSTYHTYAEMFLMKNQQPEIKKEAEDPIDTLPLHQSLIIKVDKNTSYIITAVRGGWLYKEYPNHTANTVFVPKVK